MNEKLVETLFHITAPFPKNEMPVVRRSNNAPLVKKECLAVFMGLYCPHVASRQRHCERLAASQGAASGLTASVLL